MPLFQLGVFFKSVLITNERTSIATRRYLAFGCNDIETCVIPKVRTLREFGVDESAIVSLLTAYPGRHTVKFQITVEKVKQIGLKPQQFNFVIAVKALLSMSKSTWEKKVDILKKWGWSDDDVYVAFSEAPRCMTVSENKMTSIMDIIINKSGFDPSDVVKRPQSLTFSLERRVVPRCAFYQVLMKRGLVTGKWKLRMLLESSDEQFMKKIRGCS